MGGKRDQCISERFRPRKRAGENKPRGLVAEREVHALRINASGPPAAFRGAAELLGIKSQSLRMVLIHMSQRALLGFREGCGPRNIQQQLRARIARRLGKASIEMGLIDLESPEAEIAKICSLCGVWRFPLLDTRGP